MLRTSEHDVRSVSDLTNQGFRFFLKRDYLYKFHTPTLYTITSEIV